MKIDEIGRLIRTQENRMTDQPIFVVEKSVMVITNPYYGYDATKWVNNEDGSERIADETKSRRLDALKRGGRETGGWVKLYLKETWKFVTCCFTEQGCVDFLELDGHNIGKHRIYAYGSYRNLEYRAVRNYLIQQEGTENTGA